MTFILWQGAENIYTEEGILELLHARNMEQEDGGRHILVFHCEFSSERGPKKWVSGTVQVLVILHTMKVHPLPFPVSV